MTTENWVMIAPMLLILVIAIVLIPFINIASVKFSKMAYESRQKQSSHSEVDVFASEVAKLESQTQRLTQALENLSTKLDDETLEALKENASKGGTRSADYPHAEPSAASRDEAPEEVAESNDTTVESASEEDDSIKLVPRKVTIKRRSKR